MRIILIFLCFITVAGISRMACSAPDEPRKVDVGIYVNNIPSVNLKEKKFQVDFHIWFRWSGNDIDPLESFEIVNGHIDSKDALLKKKIGNVNYASCKVSATIYRDFDLSRYPLDNHPLKIQIEDSQSSSTDMAYRPDKDNASVSPKISIPGWSIDKFESYASVTKYLTNYGDLSLSSHHEKNVPRYTFSVNIKRVGYGNFFKMFSVLFLAVILSFSAFAIRSDHLDARFALAVSGVFLAAFTQNMLATNLPDSNSFSMGDQLYNVAIAFILLTFIACILTFGVFMGGDENKANKYSRLFGVLLALAYVLANIYVVS